jgi:hypothetical protein
MRRRESTPRCVHGSFREIRPASSKPIVMTHHARIDDIDIDRAHGRAIRREIGDKLRIALNAERLPLTPRLASLLDRLEAADEQARGMAKRKGEP